MSRFLRGRGKQVVEEEPQVPQPLKRKKKGSTSRAQPSPPPSPPPPPSPQLEEEAIEEDEDKVVGISKLVKAGMYIDSDELSSFNIVRQLNSQGWLQFATFRTNWYHEIVSAFFSSLRYLTSKEGRPKIAFAVNGVSGYIEEDDLCLLFGLPKMGVDDYPSKNYSKNWPLDCENCMDELNNDRPTPKSSQVYKYNLTGDQKLAFKVIIDILLPTNSQASELTSVHIFAVCALINNVHINLPAFILKHIYHQSKKSTPWPYGMMLSHLLVHKGVPIEGCYMTRVSPFGQIGLKSLVQQELYRWNGGLWSKWEIFEKFGGDRRKIWKENGCSEPTPPKGWMPVDCSSQPEDSSFPVPPPVHRGTQEGMPSSARSRCPPRPSTIGMTQRAMSELTLDLVWRQTHYMQDLSAHLGQSERFNSFFDGSMYPDMQAPYPPSTGTQFDVMADDVEDPNPNTSWDPWA